VVGEQEVEEGPHAAVSVSGGVIVVVVVLVVVEGSEFDLGGV
jgi:hypothetical protein